MYNTVNKFKGDIIIIWKWYVYNEALTVALEEICSDEGECRHNHWNEDNKWDIHLYKV